MGKFLSNFLIAALLVALVFIVVAEDKIKSYFSGNPVGTTKEIIQNIRKEIFNPGGLIAKIESPRAFLTTAGVFDYTNTERVNAGLAAFNPSVDLNLVAKRRLDDMFAKDYFEHVSPAGESASTEADNVGYEYISIGENIALGNFENDRAVVTAWMESPGHRANILNKKFVEIGIAVGKGDYKGHSTWIAVQVFARPLSVCASPSGDLKFRIEALISKADALKSVLSRLEAEIDKAKENHDRTTYNEKVEQYNALVKEINEINLQTKGMIDAYNTQVKSFNSCIQG